MRHTLSLVIAIASLIAFSATAQAAKKIKAVEASKDRLVLMPLRLPDEDKNLMGAMETALIQGLQQKYEVFSGEQVSQKAKAIFLKESRSLNTTKKECDETRCMQDIAQAFQAELIATANVTKRDGGYFLALSIQNIFDNKVVYSNSVACESCTTFQVVNKLKELSGTIAPAVAAIPDLPSSIITGDKNDPEAVLWIEAQKGNTLDDYQVYLDRYPKGKYLPFVRARIKKIKDATEAAAEQQQQQAWDTAQQENSEASYGVYLNAYSTGRFADFAKIHLNKLKNDVAAKDPSMVRIPGKNYEMGKYEVTQKEWRDVMGSNPSKFTTCGDTCPVEQVSWNDIQKFLQKLNTKTGKQYRLPTETEWEDACWGGSQTDFCGSNDVNAVAWYGGNSDKTTHPVGSKQANGYGLYDMSGNVLEWMENKYDYYGSKSRAVRGGSWYELDFGVRATVLGGSPPADRSNQIGFRLVRTLP